MGEIGRGITKCNPRKSGEKKEKKKKKKSCEGWR
jgi:hypothetical protein